MGLELVQRDRIAIKGATDKSGCKEILGAPPKEKILEKLVSTERSWWKGKKQNAENVGRFQIRRVGDRAIWASHEVWPSQHGSVIFIKSTPFGIAESESMFLDCASIAGGSVRGYGRTQATLLVGLVNFVSAKVYLRTGDVVRQGMTVKRTEFPSDELGSVVRQSMEKTARERIAIVEATRAHSADPDEKEAITQIVGAFQAEGISIERAKRAVMDGIRALVEMIACYTIPQQQLKMFPITYDGSRELMAPVRESLFTMVPIHEELRGSFIRRLLAELPYVAESGALTTANGELVLENAEICVIKRAELDGSSS